MTTQSPILNNKIEKTNIGPENPGFTFKHLILSLLFGPSAFFILMAFFTEPWYDRNPVVWFFRGLLLGVPLAFIASLFFCGRPAKNRKARLESYFAAQPDVFFSETIRFNFNVSGIALTPTKALVGIQEAVYHVPYDRIRRAYWETPGYDQVYVYGNPGAVFHANLVNSANRGATMRGSGLFIEVADVGIPLLQLNTNQTDVLRRINEAMTQAFEHYEATPATE